MTARDIGLNLAFFALDAAILYLLWKRRRPLEFLAALAGAGFVAAILAMAMGGDQFGMLRGLAWALFVHGFIVFAGAAVLLGKTRRPPALAAATAALITAVVGIDAFFIEPTRLQITRIQLPTAKLRKPLRIVIIADLQTDVIGPFERGVLAAAKAEKPNLVLFAGDYLQEPDEKRRAQLIKELRAVLKESGFSGPTAAIAVEGNCDTPDWGSAFDGTGIAWTRKTESIRRGDFHLTALSVGDSFDTRLKVEDSNLFDIVLGHAPDFALGDVKADLLVAGHTHGGQVRLPFIGPLVTLSKVPRSWAAGVTALPGGRTLVVSRGVGMERGRAPRLRFLCAPEIVVVDVVPAKGLQ